MTVDELRKALEGLPGSAPVTVRWPRGGRYQWHKIAEVSTTGPFQRASGIIPVVVMLKGPAAK